MAVVTMTESNSGQSKMKSKVDNTSEFFTTFKAKVLIINESIGYPMK